MSTGCCHALVQIIEKSLKTIWEYLEEKVFPVSTGPGLFNQYKCWNPKVDVSDAAEIRKENLKKYLECFKEKKPRFLVIAEAPGPWGARFSGVPLVTEEQLCIERFPFAGRQSSSNGPPQPRGDFRHAQTARIFWSIMKPRHPDFLAWDAIPFHPYKEDDILSIRNPCKSELKEYRGLLLKVHSELSPLTTIAVGKKAADALKLIGVVPNQYECVRHPARGGANEFREGIKGIFSRIH